MPGTRLSTTFEPLPIPPQQQHFPPRGCSIKPKSATAVAPKPSEDQSSLTQNGFTSSSNRDQIDVDADELGYEGSRASSKRKGTKRKRKSKFDEKEAGQDTMTQWDRRWQGRSLVEMMEEDSAGVGLHDPQVLTEGVGQRQQARVSMSWLRRGNDRPDRGTQDDMIDQEKEDLDASRHGQLFTGSDSEPAAEIPETSQQSVPSDHPSTSIAQPARIASAVNRTPRNVRFKEVPSSQTPPSTKMTSRRWVRRNVIQRSPLQEKGVNARRALQSQGSAEKHVARIDHLPRVELEDDLCDEPSPAISRHSPHASIEAQDFSTGHNEQVSRHSTTTAKRWMPRRSHSPESQPLALKMLEKVRFETKQRALQAANDLDEATKGGNEREIDDHRPTVQPFGGGRRDEDAVLQKDQQAFFKPPKFGRVTTIEDSEEDLATFCEPAADHNERDAQVRHRDGNVSNSQSDGDVESNIGNEPDETSQYVDAEGYVGYDSHPATYDPAFSALDRDALRFGWTQTQGQLPALQEDSESDDDDLDRGCTPHTKLATCIRASQDKPPLELVDPTQQPAPSSSKTQPEPETPTGRHPCHPEDSRNAARFDHARPHLVDDSAYESASHRAHSDAAPIASSPPALRQSQVSTQAPTPTQKSIASSDFAFAPPQPPALGDAEDENNDEADADTNEAEVEYNQPEDDHLEVQVPDSPPQLPQRAFFHDPSENQDSGPAARPMSSSSFPLPPFSQNQRSGWGEQNSFNDRDKSGSYGGSGKRMESLSDLVDFSLPPPPPLSSLRGTPASSSR